MGIFSGLFQPKDFDGKVEKLFDYYKTNTKYISLGLIRNKQQLKTAISEIADVLGTPVEYLSYDEVKEYGSVFGTVLARATSASFFSSSNLIANTGEKLYERFGFLRTKANAEEIAKRLFNLA